jgi:Glutathione S-transferase, C-terminal domain
MTWIGRVLSDLDERLAAHQWLEGDAFSLADLAWSVDIHRFELIKFPMERYTAMLAWYRKPSGVPADGARLRSAVQDVDGSDSEVRTGTIKPGRGSRAPCAECPRQAVAPFCRSATIER